MTQSGILGWDGVEKVAAEASIVLFSVCVTITKNSTYSNKCPGGSDGLLLAGSLLPFCRVLLALHNLSRRLHEETEGLLSYRTLDRRGDHSDHRGNRHPELAALEDRGQRIIGRGFRAYDRHSGSDLPVELGQWLFTGPPVAWRAGSLRGCGFHRGLLDRPTLEPGSVHEERLSVQRCRYASRQRRFQRVRNQRLADHVPDDGCSRVLRRPDGRAEVQRER